MLLQAQALFGLHPDCDSRYLDKRIRQETNDDLDSKILRQASPGDDT